MIKQKAQFMRWTATIALTAVFVVSFAGLLMSQNKYSYGMIAPCPLMQDHLTMCPLSIAEHIAKWQQMLTVPVDAKDILLLLASVAVFSIVLKKGSRLESPPNKRILFLRNSICLLFDHLRVALSRGKIQPLFYGESA